ncbi:MAG: hypothetical protein JWQ48_2372 [Conexibacter sp.]|nr:hypothetical protein [Conexibacter sp.]
MSTPSAPIVCVCGLHGGAGTTTIATTIAAHAVALSGPGTVLLTETDPAGGGLALALAGASPVGLTELATLRAAGATPTLAPFAQMPSGLRVTAAVPAEREPAPEEAVSEVLADASRAHSLTVVDCGSIREPHRHGALPVASALVWTIAATAPSGLVRQLATGPLARSARHLPWLLAVSDTRGDGAREALADLRDLVPGVRRVVLVPQLARLAADDERRGLVASQVIEGLSA